MTKTEFAKAITGFVVGAATARTVKMIISNNVAPESVPDKAAVIIASYIIGQMVGSAATKWTATQINKVIAEVKKSVDEYNSQHV